MLVDGLRFNIRGSSWVQYTTALKPVGSSTAYFLDPVFVSGCESAPNWQRVFSMVSPSIATRVRALVADGLRGLKEIAAGNGWIYQRCHFHVWALLRFWLWPLERGDNRAIHQAVSATLMAKDSESADAARSFLQAYVAANPGGMSCMLKQLLRDWCAVRAHIDYPDLQIPSTTNAVESMHNLIRQAVSRTSTIDGILRRSTALIRLHPPFTCNGHLFQQK